MRKYKTTFKIWKVLDILKLQTSISYLKKISGPSVSNCRTLILAYAGSSLSYDRPEEHDNVIKKKKKIFTSD